MWKVVDTLQAEARPRIEALLLQLIEKAEHWKAVNRACKTELHESRDQSADLLEQLREAQHAALQAMHKFEAEQEARLEQEQETVNHQLQFASLEATIHTLELELEKQHADCRSQTEQLVAARKIQAALEASTVENRRDFNGLLMSKAASDLKAEQLNQTLKHFQARTGSLLDGLSAVYKLSLDWFLRTAQSSLASSDRAAHPAVRRQSTRPA